MFYMSLHTYAKYLFLSSFLPFPSSLLPPTSPSILTDCQLMVDNALNWNTKGDTVYSAAEQLGTIDIPRLVREICVPKLKEVKKKFKKLKKEKLKKEKEEKEAAAKEEAAKELKALDAAS